MPRFLQMWYFTIWMRQWDSSVLRFPASSPPPRPSIHHSCHLGSGTAAGRSAAPPIRPSPCGSLGRKAGRWVGRPLGVGLGAWSYKFQYRAGSIYISMIGMRVFRSPLTPSPPRLGPAQAARRRPGIPLPSLWRPRSRSSRRCARGVPPRIRYVSENTAAKQTAASRRLSLASFQRVDSW